jgi:hypothetical protein
MLLHVTLIQIKLGCVRLENFGKAGDHIVRADCQTQEVSFSL